MSLVLVGLSHRSAPVAVRERYAVLPADALGLDEKLLGQPQVEEALVVSTCNRTEIVALVRGPSAAPALLRFLRDEIGDGSAAPDQIYVLHEGDVVSHVFRVAASLDSMVVGEAQILGQVKQAYRAAVRARSCGPVLNRLFQHAFRAAKRIRSETGLGSAQVSIARVGVQLAREIFEDFEAKRVLLLGAGEMAESALSGLRDAGVHEVVVVNRTLASAVGLAGRLGGRARAFEALHEELGTADIALSSVQVSEPILGSAALEQVMAVRGGKPLLLIDLGLPRNVDPAAQQLANLYLYDLDDLEEVAERGRESRRAAVEPAESRLGLERERFERWQAALPLVPTIRALRERALALALSEVGRTVGGLDGDPERNREALERMAEAIVRKILHRPLEQLRAEAEEGSVYYSDAIRALFGLEEEEE